MVQNFVHAQRARLYAVYAQFVRSLDVEGAWYVRVLSVFRRCLCVRNWLLARTSLTNHLQNTHISLTKHAQSTYVPLTNTYQKLLTHETRTNNGPYVIHQCSCAVHAWSIRVTFAIHASIERQKLYRVWACALLCVECSFFVSDCKWYMRSLYAIHRWFWPRTTPENDQFLHEQSRTNLFYAWSMRDLCVIGNGTGPLHFIMP